MYRVPTYFTCVFLFVFGIVVYIGRWQSRWQSSDLKSDLLYEALISIIALQSLHTGLYHGNIIAWRATGINYSQRLDFSSAEDLYSHPYLTLVAYMACVGIYLSAHIIEINDINLGIFYITISFATIIGYYSEVWRIISFISPEVTMANVFMADQLCSQVTAIRKILYIFGYFITVSYKKHHYGFYKTSTVYRVLSYVVSCLPFLCRGLQCGRMWYDERQKTSHLINLGKYFFAMLEALARVAYENDKTAPVWLSLLVVISIAATVYQLYWDFVKDWGLLQFSSKNRWLRNELILSWKYIYYLSMGSNLILRFAWILTLILPIANLDDGDVTFLVAVFEVIRRVQWNFYRLENQEVIKRHKSN